MKAHLLSMSIAGSLLMSLVACSEETHFTEKSLPIAMDASAPSTDTPDTDVDGTDPNASVDPDGTNGGVSDPGSGSGTDPDAPAADGAEVFSDCNQHPDKAIVADLRLFTGDPSTGSTYIKKLDDFNGIAPQADKVCLSLLNISTRDFSEGFPGVSQFEWFSLDMVFKLQVPVSGVYKMFLNSDDGSILYIDGAKVIDNDGTHSPYEKSKEIYLTAGQHDVRVRYYQGPRHQIALELFWTVPGSDQKVYVPSALMSRAE